MTKSTIVICDGCQKDLPCEGLFNEWKLVLSVDPIPVRPISPPYPEGSEPPIDDVKHFCGLGCLKLWVTADGGES